MIYQAIEAIAERFDREDYKYRISEGEDACRLITGISCDNTEIDIQFFSSDDENDVSVRVFRLVRFPEDKYPEMLEAVNTLNRAYRFVRFVADKNDRSVDIHFDFLLSTQDVGEAAVEIFSRLPNIVDEAFPQLMKIIWAN